MPRLIDGSDGLQEAATTNKDNEVDVRGEMRIRVKNRRKRYLDLHPDYFLSPDRELADPLLYDRLIRRFQSASEREKEGRQRGYTGSLEADLLRSEAKLAALQNPDPNSPITYRRAAGGEITGVEQDEEDRAQSKEEGLERWQEYVRRRFVQGRDQDFEYAAVDESEEYDDRGEEERKGLEVYLEKQEAEFLGVGKPSGETGVQDF